MVGTDEGFEKYIWGSVGELRLDRPAVRNALRLRDKQGIQDCLREFEHSPEVRSVIISSADPRGFCAGTDIAEMADLTAEGAVTMFDVEKSLYASILESPLPVIAAVSGAAFGAGCILASCADIAIAGSSARFAMPEVRLGVPAPLQTALLPQIIGLARARRMLLLGETYNAQEALDLGLVTEVVSDEALRDRVLQVAETLESLPATGIRSHKRLMNSWISGDYGTSVSLSSYVAASALMEEPARDAVRAFLNRVSSSSGGSRQ